MTKLVVVIVSYNGEDWMDTCLGSLRASTLEPQVVVVDNASADDTVPIIRQRYPEVTLVESGGNLGFGRGNNLGIRLALDRGAEFVFLLNQDAWVQPRALERLVQVARDNPEFGIISPLHLNPAGDGLDPNHAQHLKAIADQLPGDPLQGATRPLYELPFTNAAAWLMSRRCLETVGGFDPLFFLYGEDDDLVARLRFFGLKMGLHPGARIHHARHQQPRRRSLKQRLELATRQQRTLGLMLLKDPRHGLGRQLALLGLRDLRAGLSRLLQGRPLQALAVAQSALELAGELPRVAKNRRRGRQPGRTFLTDD